jgi:probable lipoprotein NlpC
MMKTESQDTLTRPDEAQAHWTEPYIGLPFESRGRDRAGVDCYGLMRLVYSDQLGIDLPAWDEDYEAEVAESVAGVIGAVLTPTGFARLDPAVDPPREFDAILMRLRGLPAHVGVVVFPNLMLHVKPGSHTCLQPYAGPQWNRRILGFYRHEMCQISHKSGSQKLKILS